MAKKIEIEQKGGESLPLARVFEENSVVSVSERPAARFDSGCCEGIEEYGEIELICINCVKKDCHGPWHCKAGERITWLTLRIYDKLGLKSRIINGQ